MSATRRIASAFLVLLGALVLFQGSADAATACSTREPLDVSLSSAHVVFGGKVTEVATGSVTFAVTSVWKGPNQPERVTVRQPTGLDRGRDLQLDRNYLVILESGQLPYTFGSCTATQLYETAGLDIPASLRAAVDADQARPPLTSGSPSTDAASPQPLALSAVAAFVLGTGLGGLRVRAFMRRRRDAKSRLIGPDWQLLGSQVFGSRARTRQFLLDRFRRWRRYGWRSLAGSRTGRR